MDYITYFNTPLGEVLLASDGTQLIGVWFTGQKYFGATLQENQEEKDNLPLFIRTKDWLNHYFEGKNPALSDLPLAPRGGAFRQEVWAVLRSIPYGQTMTYKDVAQKIAEKRGLPSMSSQAVGGAVGHNPISIIVPCHRIVGANGSLTGFASGVQRKVHLLELECQDMSTFFVPKKGTAL